MIQLRGRWSCKFIDVTNGEKDKIRADMVVIADGVHSSLRKVLRAPARQDYAGYIAWRGTVPEHLLSPQTVKYFSNRLNFSFLKGSYFISYIIPTESGYVEPGKRLINWVWYFPMPEGSPEMASVFTDIHGKVHPYTVAQGLLNPEVWAKQLARFLPQMTAPLADMLTKTPRPFVTKVGEAQCSTASFYDGRVVLVGDAFTRFRSHLGMASEQAARHCIQMDRVWRGEISQEERDQQATLYAKRFILLNRMIGLMRLGVGWALFKTVVSYVWLMTQYRLGLV